MVDFDLDTLLRQDLTLMPFAEGGQLVYRADKALHRARLQKDNGGLYVDHNGQRLSPTKDREIKPVWNGIQPDNEDQAFTFVRWMEKKNRKKIAAVWIVMTASDHFLGIPLLFGANTYPVAYHGQSVLPYSNSIAAHRGALAFKILDESRDVVIGPGDLVIGDLGAAEASSTGFTYTLQDPLVLGQAGSIKDASGLFVYEPYSSSMFVSVLDLENEEGRSIARGEPDDALMVVFDGSLSTIEVRGSRMYGFDDSDPYFEAIMPKEDGIYYVSDITLVSARDWESGHIDIEIEADWAIATPDNLESFGMDRESLETELCVGHEIPLANAMALIEEVYLEELRDVSKH